MAWILTAGTPGLLSGTHAARARISYPASASEVRKQGATCQKGPAAVINMQAPIVIQAAPWLSPRVRLWLQSGPLIADVQEAECLKIAHSTSGQEIEPTSLSRQTMIVNAFQLQ